jgi:hypothetical protein
MSVYPNAIDGYAQLPLVIDNSTPINAITVNSLRSAIINIENELGRTPSGSYDTVRARLDALETEIASIGTASNIAEINSRLDALEADVAALQAITTTKGDIPTHNGTAATKLAVGANGYVLTADSTEPTGIKWAAPTGGGGASGGGVYKFIWQPGGTEDTDTNTYTTWASLNAAMLLVNQFAPIEIYYDNSNADGTITTGAWALPTDLTLKSNFYNRSTIEIDNGATFLGIANLDIINLTLLNNSSAVVYDGPGISIQLRNSFLESSTGQALFKITSFGSTSIQLYGQSAFLRNGGAGDKPVVWHDTNSGTMVISLYDESYVETNTLKSSVGTTVELEFLSTAIDDTLSINTYNNTHASVAGTLNKELGGRVEYLGIKKRDGTNGSNGHIVGVTGNQLTIAAPSTFGIGAGGGYLWFQKDFPRAPNTTIEYNGWVPVAATLSAVRVKMETVNTQGSYTLTITNVTTAATVLNAASFDMNTLVAGAVTSLTLTGTSADLSFSAGGEWVVSLVSNSASFDGAGIYVELLFGVS